MVYNKHATAQWPTVMGADCQLYMPFCTHTLHMPNVDAYDLFKLYTKP